ncbi:site-specific integrase [Pseudodesulfovibrio karagichevae]|uniref:Tyrosine recombinase XerC n=1 Tax=Pseudodesulfovibrio karagichevae TaxID=3239305 RepID=A0ABV4JXM6_9BACT
MGKSDSLKYGINRATLSGPKSKQHRIRQTAHHFVKVLRQANMGAQKWTKVTNKHFQRVADAMRADGVGDGRIAEVFSAARHICRAYGNNHISKNNAIFGVRRGSIANATSRAVSPEVIQDTLTRMRNDTSYPQAGRAAAQIELMYELGLRREESAKLDLPNDWDRESHSLLVRYGTKGGRPRTLYDLSPQQEAALERAEEYVSPSDRKGINNLMPEGMGDEWLHRLDYAARKHSLTGKDAGGTLHGLRHERFRQMYADHTGFEPPNQYDSVQAFHEAAQATAGDNWPQLDDEARDNIEVAAGHSPGRRDVSNAYLGCSI